jgi:cell division transport system permease protein
MGESREEPDYPPHRAAASRRPAVPRHGSAIVPRNPTSARALMAIIAIMTFLAALTSGAVMLVRMSAGEWEADVAREVTIQIRPAEGRDLDAAAVKAAALARAAPGVASVRPLTRDESAQLLEPWLGSGLSLDDLPVPRMVVIKLAPDAAPDLATLRKTLTEQVSGASLDDHRGWIDRMRTMATTAIFAGGIILALVLAATMLSVMFATRGVMAANQPVIEVLHFIGARDRYIAAHFQRHFLALGLQGGLVGGGAALLLFLIAGLISRWFSGYAAGEQMSALFGTFSIGIFGYIAVVSQIVLVAAVTALTSRHTVKRTLEAID